MALPLSLYPLKAILTRHHVITWHSASPSPSHISTSCHSLLAPVHDITYIVTDWLFLYLTVYRDYTLYGGSLTLALRAAELLMKKSRAINYELIFLNFIVFMDKTTLMDHLLTNIAKWVKKRDHLIRNTPLRQKIWQKIQIIYIPTIRESAVLPANSQNKPAVLSTCLIILSALPDMIVSSILETVTCDQHTYIRC